MPRSTTTSKTATAEEDVVDGGGVPSDPILTLWVGGGAGGPAAGSSTSAKGVLGSPAPTSSVASVCFLNVGGGGDAENGRAAAGETADDAVDNEESDSDDGGDSSSDDEDVQFRCGALAGERQRRRRVVVTDVASSAPSMPPLPLAVLSGRLLASCHADGSALIWDLEKRRVVQGFDCRGPEQEKGPGLLLRRVDDGDCGGAGTSRLVYQTRDFNGTVSLHDAEYMAQQSPVGGEIRPRQPLRLRTVRQFETFSRTFCCAAPCAGNGNLIALPTEDDGVACVKDWRVPFGGSSVDSVVATLDPASSSQNYGAARKSFPTQRRYGMITSLAMSQTTPMGDGGPEHDFASRPLVVACGTESGSVFFYDLRNARRPVVVDDSSAVPAATEPPPSPSWSSMLELSKVPVLSLDMVPSPQQQPLPGPSGSDTRAHASSIVCGSVVAAAGMAGTGEADSDGDGDSHRETIALVKATAYSDSDLRTRVRAQISTCSSASAGKPGVSLCRFRSGDGRLFAVGGWDMRLRIFDRAVSGRDVGPLAILRGHAGSVNAVDWAPDAAESGLLATASDDGRICVWRCFPSSSSRK